MHVFEPGTFLDGEGGPSIRSITWGKEVGIPPITIKNVSHEPYVAELSSDKTRIMFAPEGALSGALRNSEALARRALAKVDPRISYKDYGDHLTFHGFLVPPAYQGKAFSQPVFDWLMDYADERGTPVTNTTSINKPVVSLFVSRQKDRYGFEPDSREALAEIFPTPVPTETAVIRWLYNTLPAERRRSKARGFTFYEVVDGDDTITTERAPLDPNHHVVAMHTPYSRAL